MKVVIAPDKFAGTLSAAQAAAAIAQGWRSQRPDDDLFCVPMADGGDGTLDALEAAVPAVTRHSAEVADARGHAVVAEWVRLPDGRAVIESAQACGLHRLSADQRIPRLATTYGVGQLIAAAAASGASDIVVGLGGSATVDGGAGMATALGHRLLREDGNGVKVGAEYLAALHRIVPAQPTALRIVAAADVDAPLLGPGGAVAGFAVQKGATPEDLPILETALSTLADVAERDLGGTGSGGGPWRDRPGAGAAGGLGFGLAAFTGARIHNGAVMVAELVGLASALRRADVVVTGEGRLDAWSTRGKVPGLVAQLGRDCGAGVYAVAGTSDAQGPRAFDDVVLLGPEGIHDAAAAVSRGAAALAARIRSLP